LAGLGRHKILFEDGPELGSILRWELGTKRGKIIL
jgi:hypothetical protein